MGDPPAVRQLPLRLALAVGYFIQTLGCPKNEADSDALRRALDAEGHSQCSAERADWVIVNTCGFIDAAKEESIAALLDAADYAHGRGARLAAIGCLVERYADDLAAELPEVDLWCGLDWAPLLQALAAPAPSLAERPPAAAARRPRRSLVHAFIKISDGCDHRCSFCSIPAIKGQYRALAAEEIITAARDALGRGARELVLVGQDTTRWRQQGWGDLGRLLATLSELEPAPRWLRLLYLQPEGVDDAVLEALAAYAVPYVDLPLQHAAGAVLRRMRRPGDGDAYLELLARVRRTLPRAAVRSTFIVGFPGETDDDVDELIAFIAAAGLAAAGVFLFDAQEGTAAAALPDQVATEVACERLARVGAAIDQVAAEFWQGMVGETVAVLIERGSKSADRPAVGRSSLQAPDIDGRTLVYGSPLRRGEVVDAVVTGAAGYDLETAVRRPS